MKPTEPQTTTPWLAGFGVFFVLGYLLFGWVSSTGPPTQPLRYNHAVHIANGLECTDCHEGVLDRAQATLPTLDTCLLCHAEALTESAEEEKIRAFARAGQDIPWQQITRVPVHVYFSHRRHVSLGGLECADCHGPMEKLTEPPRRSFHPVTMDRCMECHEQKGVRNDCNDCHR